MDYIKPSSEEIVAEIAARTQKQRNMVIRKTYSEKLVKWSLSRNRYISPPLIHMDKFRIIL